MERSEVIKFVLQYFELRMSISNSLNNQRLIMITESTIILAVIGMIGLFSTAVIYQRSNRITSVITLRNEAPV